MDEATEIIRSFNEERIAHQREMAEMKKRLEASKSALINSEKVALDCFNEWSKLRAETEELKSQLAEKNCNEKSS